MKIIIFRKLILWGPSIILLILAIQFMTKASGAEDLLKSSAGPPFIDPSQIPEMPDSWEKQPIMYDSSIGNTDLVVSLGQQMYLAFLPIIQKYAAEHNLKIVVYRGTCGLSAGGLSRKSIDIGAFCCPPGTTDRLPGLQFHTLGIASIALLVHPDNPVNDITLDQARQIFMGKIYRWPEVLPSESGKSIKLKIQPVGRLHCKIRSGHWRLLLDNEDLFSPHLFEVGTIPDMISRIAMKPGAIGYEILWMTRYYQDTGNAKILKINKYSPDDPSHLLSTNYPLYRVYNLTTWEGENVSNPHAQKLVNYLLQQVDHLDRKYSFIPTSRLKQAGWKFKDKELIGEPE